MKKTQSLQGCACRISCKNCLDSSFPSESCHSTRLIHVRRDSLVAVCTEAYLYEGPLRSSLCSSTCGQPADIHYHTVPFWSDLSTLASRHSHRQLLLMLPRNRWARAGHGVWVWSAPTSPWHFPSTHIGCTCTKMSHSVASHKLPFQL